MKSVNPKVGEAVILRHTVEREATGDPVICGATAHKESTVEALYHNGKVRVASGDIWGVTRLDNGKLATVAR